VAAEFDESAALTIGNAGRQTQINQQITALAPVLNGPTLADAAKVASSTPPSPSR
jgi:hypothetical protein